MILEKIKKPNDIHKIPLEDFEPLAAEIRDFLIRSVSQTGGHLASNLGVVELTLALHNVLDFPEDKLIWDVGHQAYTHKILTGRKDEFKNLRQEGGLSGFPKRKESDCDAYDAGHSSNSISAGLGYVRARDILGQKHYVVSVIGDGALTGGMAYEALNNAAELKTNFIIIINDNNMSISRNVGGMSTYLSVLRTAEAYTGMKLGVTKTLKKVPKVGTALVDTMRKTKSSIKQLFIPGMLFEQGMREEQVRKTMKETYLISDEKLNLAIDISRRESRILSDINYKEGYSLYVGIPFCPTTCLYCSFTSYPISMYKDKVDSYVDSVIKEIKFLGEQLKGRELNTVYIGGGTPTTLEPDQMDRLITSLKENFDFSTVREFTVEAGRPDSITEEKLKTLKKHNVSRISINPQTMNQKTLDIIGRRHTVEQVKEAFKLARQCGFNNINMDFILGLPQEDEKMVRYSMEEAKKLSPEGITVHSLALKRAARLNIMKDKYSDMHMENSSELMKVTEKYSEEMNMKPYYLYRQKNMAGNQENVGYSIEGCEGLYNILMMGDFQDVWAVGAGAVTKLLSPDRKEGKRIDTVKNVDQYIERIDEMIERKRKYFQSMGC